MVREHPSVRSKTFPDCLRLSRKLRLRGTQLIQRTQPLGCTERRMRRRFSSRAGRLIATDVECNRWPKHESPLAPHTLCRRICEKLLFLTRRPGQNGKTLPRWRAMSGFAGSSPSRNRKRESSTSSESARSSKKECAGRVAGQAALTAEIFTR
jgi:hypothetical protein